MRKFLLFLIFLIGAGIGAVYWLLADPNRFKGEISALISRETGLTVELRGDLAWRLWPPVRLVANDVVADWTMTGEVPLVAINSVELDADLWPLITGERALNVNGVAIIGLNAHLVAREGRANWLPPGSAKPKSVPIPVAAAPPDAHRTWAIDVVSLRDSRIDYDLDGDRYLLEVDEIIVTDVSPGITSPVRAVFRLTTEDRIADIDLHAALTATGSAMQVSDGEMTASIDALPMTVTFNANYDIARARLDVNFDATLDSLTIPVQENVAIGGGTFATLAFAAPAIAQPDLDQPILPLEALRAVDWNGTVKIGELHYDGATFKEVALTTAGKEGDLRGTLTLPQFFGGHAATDWTVDARAVPRWHLTSKVADMDSRALLAWLDKQHEWVAMLVGGTDLSMTGNTRRELSQSVAGRTTFDAGQGRLDIRGLRDLALSIASRAGGTERIEAWPEVLDYKRFTGHWDVNGIAHQGKVLLDNLSLELDGTIDPITDAIDMALAVTVLEEPQLATFKIDPLLMGLALPVRCKGTAIEPNCKADEDGMKKLMAQALSGNNPEMTERLDKAIDEKVPEQYRDAARSLLDMLRKGQQNKQPAPN